MLGNLSSFNGHVIVVTLVPTGGPYPCRYGSDLTFITPATCIISPAVILAKLFVIPKL